MNGAYGYGLALLMGAAGAWYVQGLRWDSDVADIREASDRAILANVNAVSLQLETSRAQSEQIRQVFLDYKTGKENETSILQRAVDSGAKRLRIDATCGPAVQPTGAPAGRVEAGTAELTPAAGRAYFALQRGLDEQFALLQLCRAELIKRSK